MTERFLLSLKSELLRKILVPFAGAELRLAIEHPRNLELVVSGLHGAPASLLPIITLRDAA